ncbi:hypothetical protein KDA_44830 [Dictyobacter alpinus]|uniref:DinB-like domain-containing protein n=1 Tax=Dictyobacter alpinus TaxID=2014873 RepID=A0A402BCC8_9CHLR|nr:hypothetical protein [Dictyobacter alpinus]GCE28999.1 hypothetical protein KDA_44830 [Dictyobacter alpinus]
MPQEQLLQKFADAYEQTIAAATEATQRGITGKANKWGPREIIAHLAGWEVLAAQRIPYIAAGMAPFAESDEQRQSIMDNALNAMMVTMIGDQSFEQVCGILRHAYQDTIAMLRKLDEKSFQPGTYAYERTVDVLDHCKEHIDQISALHHS